MPSAAPPLPTPTPDELDDLIYFSRAGDLESLRQLITNLCATHSCPPSVILASAIDVDEDGLGSQSSLLHYPAANGNLEVVKYILGLLTPSDALGSSVGATTADKSAPALVNHKNVNGNTPLHWAGINGHLDVVKALVGAGADPGIVNAAGRDAVFESEISAKEGAAECAEWMLKECEGLEKGVGGGQEEEGEAAQEDVESMRPEEEPSTTTTKENGTTEGKAT
ncbi:uncharacterized protein PV06_01740 [Exophiala oligosperma]|uniref:Uncharacterized protein n=2 Tax=Chaetothyriales TaxID=34395 RepID=A0A0D2C8E5_9EURO|nr:uncharacterized protein PV06_01740 [Exophiala oligosperma]KAJ9625439.1 ankyrin repeat-containing protein [Knufia peltigerae]KIW46047.1 hypothetical protein PV06_01740 [Exophiala oligosperma]